MMNTNIKQLLNMPYESLLLIRGFRGLSQIEISIIIYYTIIAKTFKITGTNFLKMRIDDFRTYNIYDSSLFVYITNDINKIFDSHITFNDMFFKGKSTKSKVIILNKYSDLLLTACNLF